MASKGLTMDEASPDLLRIVASNQAWAEANGHAKPGSAEHGALRAQDGDPKKKPTNG